MFMFWSWTSREKQQDYLIENENVLYLDKIIKKCINTTSTKYSESR